jgi:zinc transport system ATP-binding protein
VEKTIISLKDVSFSYDRKPFIRKVNLEIKERDFLGLIGPNGGGKTTIIRLILGLLEPDSGSISVFGKSPEEGRKHIGYLSQFKNIDFDFPITVEEIVLQSRLTGIFKKPGDDDKLIVRTALKDVGLWEKRGKTLNQLSGGEKQRVFIARALASEPELLIMDEPMSNVDMHIQETLYQLLRKINERMAILVVDHNLDTLSKYAKEVACINKCEEHGIKYHDLVKKEKARSCDIKW